MMDRYCLLLTGTISPNAIISRLDRKDHLVRENDYYQAIQAWMKLGISIIFCENSNYNSQLISKLFREYSYSAEYLKFQSDINITEKGKGEAEILDYCYRNSKILNKFQFIIKCTGRLYVNNFSHIIQRISKDKFNFVYADLVRNMTWANSMFFIYDTVFYTEYLQKYLKRVDESAFVYFEHALARAIHASMADGYKFSLLPYPVEFLGFHGTSNEKIKNDFFRKIKRAFVLELRKWSFKQG